MKFSNDKLARIESTISPHLHQSFYHELEIKISHSVWNSMGSGIGISLYSNDCCY